MRKVSGFVVGIALALGCSSGAHKASSDIRSFCEDYLKAAADRQVTCKGGARDAYDTLLRAMAICETAASTLAAAHVRFDPDAAAACVAGISDLECWQDTGFPPSCNKVFTGSLPEGSSCYAGLLLNAEECAPGTHCSAPGLACTATCVRYARLGEACDGAAVQCEPPLNCGTSAVCVDPMLPAVSVGIACTSSTDCIGSNGVLTCAATGTCEAPTESPKHIGDACAPGAFECGSAAFCGPASTCIVWPTAGQSCAGNAGEGEECLDGACDLATMICVPFRQKGDPCPPGPSYATHACGYLTLACDSNTLTCQPLCLPGVDCGAPGQNCCAEQFCNAGAACVGGVCL